MLLNVNFSLGAGTVKREEDQKTKKVESRVVMNQAETRGDLKSPSKLIIPRLIGKKTSVDESIKSEGVSLLAKALLSSTKVEAKALLTCTKVEAKALLSSTKVEAKALLSSTKVEAKGSAENPGKVEQQLPSQAPIERQQHDIPSQSSASSDQVIPKNQNQVLDEKSKPAEIDGSKIGDKTAKDDNVKNQKQEEEKKLITERSAPVKDHQQPESKGEIVKATTEAVSKDLNKNEVTGLKHVSSFEPVSRQPESGGASQVKSQTVQQHIEVPLKEEKQAATLHQVTPDDCKSGGSFHMSASKAVQTGIAVPIPINKTNHRQHQITSPLLYQSLMHAPSQHNSMAPVIPQSNVLPKTTPTTIVSHTSTSSAQPIQNSQQLLQVKPKSTSNPVVPQHLSTTTAVASPNQMQHYQQLHQNLWHSYNSMNMAAALSMSQQAAGQFSQQLTSANGPSGPAMFESQHSIGITPTDITGTSTAVAQQLNPLLHCHGAVAQQANAYSHHQSLSQPSIATMAPNNHFRFQNPTKGSSQPVGPFCTSEVNRSKQAGSTKKLSTKQPTEPAVRHQDAVITPGYLGYPLNSVHPHGVANGGSYYCSDNNGSTPASSLLAPNYLIQPYGQNSMLNYTGAQGYNLMNPFMYHMPDQRNAVPIPQIQPSVPSVTAPIPPQQLYPGYPHLGYPMNYQR